MVLEESAGWFFGPDTKTKRRVRSINDLANAKTLAHLLKYDSVHGIMNAEVKDTEKSILVTAKK